jgi:hypothetical protein
MPYSITVNTSGAKDSKQLASFISNLVKELTGYNTRVFINDKSKSIQKTNQQFKDTQGKLHGK